MIDRSGAVIVGTTGAGTWNSCLAVVRLVNGVEQPVRAIHSARGAITLLAIDGAGRTALFLRYLPASDGRLGPRQLFTVQTDGDGLRQLTDEPAGVSAGTMSADGRVIWYVTGSARLLKLDVSSGEIKEVIARSPFLDGARLSTAGSATRFTGAGLAGSLEVRFDGEPIPTIWTADEELVLQLPWEATSGKLDLIWRPHSESPFEFVDAGQSAILLRDLPQTNPRFEILNGYALDTAYPHVLAVHDESGAWVTPDSPAKPGEIVHVYAVGLGPVSPAVRTGEPGPNSPLASLMSSVKCSALGSPLPVYFAGLAPQTVGFYQISLRLPESIVSDGLALTSTVDRFSDNYGYPLDGSIATAASSR
jgi:uncharacterized protein (TIGR03437 family)